MGLAPQVTSALISGGSSLLGGLIGKKDSLNKRKHLMEKQDRLQRKAEIRADARQRDMMRFTHQQNNAAIRNLPKLARESGFNALTLLRNGAAGIGGGGGTPGVSQSSGPGIPSLASSNFVGEAISNAGNSIAGVFAAKADEERDRLENDILKEELRQLQNNNKMIEDRNFGFSIPHAVNYTGVTNGNADQDLTRGNSGRHPDRGDLRVADVDVVPSEDWSDAEDIEQRYGDFASAVYGLAVAGADARKTYNHNYNPIRPRMRPVRRRGYSPGKNPPLRGYYGPPGSRTGF